VVSEDSVVVSEDSVVVSEDSVVVSEDSVDPKPDTLSEYLNTNYEFTFDGYTIRIAYKTQRRMLFIYVYSGTYTKGDKPYKSLKTVSSTPDRFSECITKYIYSQHNVNLNQEVVEFIVDEDMQDDLERVWAGGYPKIPPTCKTCHLIECCCEADRLQVIEDDARAKERGWVDDGK
jgi:hypothetical protein